MACGRLRLEVAVLAQPIEDRLARLVPIAADELAARAVDARLLVEDVDRLQAVALAELVVVRVVGRCDLHRPGAEGAVDVVVGHDRQSPTQEGQDDLAADEVAISLVVGMDRHRGVAEQRLGTGGGDADPRIGIRGAVWPR